MLLGLAGCSAARPAVALPPGLTVEEVALKAGPALEPLTFTPVKGTMADILAKHASEREDSFADPSFYFEYRPGMQIDTARGKLVALDTFSPGPAVDSGRFDLVTVNVTLNGDQIYSIPTGVGSPINSLQGLWAYGDHWAMEVVQVDPRMSAGNVVSFDNTGQVIQDGTLLNESRGYQEAFGFQLMNGKPFYFFKREGKIGVSFAGQEVPLGYDQVPHYGCCSAAEENPIKAQKMVAFFAQRDGQWYYVEIGDFR